MKNRPMTRVNLDKAIARMAGNDPRLSIEIRMSMANAIVGQFLPEGVVINTAKVNLGETRVACERLFRYRKCQPWPPVVVKQDGWEEIYAAQKLDLPVLPTVDEAIVWTNQLISTIDAS